MDLLAIDPTTRKAYMAYDECWYCMHALRKGLPDRRAVKVEIPYLLR